MKWLCVRPGYWTTGCGTWDAHELVNPKEWDLTGGPGDDWYHLSFATLAEVKAAAARIMAGGQP